MATIELTQPAYEVLRAEAERDIENSIGERHLFRGEEEGDRHERILLACADVLGSLGRWAPLDSNPGGWSYEFTEEALVWMRTVQSATQDHLDELDTSEEGELDYIAKETYLHRVLNRILDANAEAVTV